MDLKEKLTTGLERAAKEAEKALEKGKAKVGELQIEMQMDGLAKKLGYLVFDFYRGRPVDQALRQKILDDLARLEDQLLQAKAEAAAKAEEARAAAGAQEAGPGASAGTGPGPAPGAAEAATGGPAAGDADAAGPTTATSTSEAAPAEDAGAPEV
jgi:hypothetical protein